MLRLLFRLIVIVAWCGLVVVVRAEVLLSCQGGVYRASYYGYKGGHVIASGEQFRREGLTAAHRRMPYGGRLMVEFIGRRVMVRINDRGPAMWTGRCLDLSKGAGRVLGTIKAGVVAVRIKRLNQPLSYLT
jgi:rare lipoprotein A